MTKLRKAAKGQECTLRTHCDGSDTETTVLAHGRGAGMATKLKDYVGVHACWKCHQYLDTCPGDEFDRIFPEALRKTLNRVHDMGLIG